MFLNFLRLYVGSMFMVVGAMVVLTTVRTWTGAVLTSQIMFPAVFAALTLISGIALAGIIFAIGWALIKRSIKKIQAEQAKKRLASVPMHHPPTKDDSLSVDHQQEQSNEI